MRHHRGALVCDLYQQQEVLGGLLAEMEYSDVLRFVDNHAMAHMQVSDPEQVKAVARGIRQSLHKLSSEEIRQHVDSFNAERSQHASKINVTGHPVYDRSREYS